MQDIIENYKVRMKIIKQNLEAKKFPQDNIEAFVEYFSMVRS